MKISSHILCIRFKYEKEEDMLNRLKLFEEITIPALEDQTEKDFTLCLIINKDHETIIRDRIKFEFISFYSLADYADFIKNRNILLQSRLDSDDWVCSEYIEDIQRRVSDIIECMPRLTSAVVHYAVRKHNLSTGRIWDREKPYKDTLTSMFLTVWFSRDPVSVYKYSHDEWHKHVSHVETAPHGYVLWNMHNDQFHLNPKGGDYDINDKI
jgi:hypothetical protein